MEAIFDAPTSIQDLFIPSKKSLTDPDDRMEFVDDIAKQFNYLMNEKRPYMEDQLNIIRNWIDA